MATSNPLTTKPLDLMTITNELAEVTQWHSLGVQLKVPQHVLSKIEEDHSRVERRKSEVISYWLKNEKPSWDTLADAVERLGHGRLGNKLRDAKDNLPQSPTTSTDGESSHGSHSTSATRNKMSQSSDIDVTKEDEHSLPHTDTHGQMHEQTRDEIDINTLHAEIT